MDWTALISFLQYATPLVAAGIAAHVRLRIDMARMKGELDGVKATQDAQAQHIRDRDAEIAEVVRKLNDALITLGRIDERLKAWTDRRQA